MITPEAWKPTEGIDLSDAGNRTVREIGKNIAVIALPGTGKTELLAQRANYLLETGKASYPSRILAISFKVDAAANLAQRVRMRCGFLANRFDSFTFHAFAKRIIDRFRPVLAGRDALDADYTIGAERVLRKQLTFADLLPLAIAILQNSAQALRAVQQTYKFVFLDEFQDCTQTQFRLIEILFAERNVRLTAVGDPCQAIMNFAGDVLPGIFQEFVSRFSPAEVERLYINHRSKPRLRRLQNAIVAVLEPTSAVAEASIEGEEGEIDVVHYATDDQEAEGLSVVVAAWVAGGVPLNEIGIVLRNSVQLYCTRLFAAFDAHGIPWRNEDAAQNLCSEPLAELVVDFLHVIFDEQQPAAYSRLLDVLSGLSPLEDQESGDRWPKWLSGKRALARVGDTAPEAVWSHVEALFQTLGREAITALSAEYQNPSRLEEVTLEIRGLLNSSLNRSRSVPDALRMISEGEAVRIMTIHKCKGLEFDSVILLGVEQEAFFGNANEQRKAFFVGVSRAKDRLLLTVVDHRPKPMGGPGWWREVRNVHVEFIEYAAPYCRADDVEITQRDV